MAGRSAIPLLAALLAVLVALAGLTYVWLSAQRTTDQRPGNQSVMLTQVRLVPEFPIALAFAPDRRVFYAERHSGNIRILGNATTDTTTFYTLTGTDSSGERGLLGLALDPEFPTMPYVYAFQTYNDGANGTVYNRIVRIRGNGSAGVSHSVILRLPPLTAARNHNGGVIAFGLDRMLYAVVGENAIPSLSQNPASPLGKVLRMTREGWAPLDNPFVNDPAWFNLTYTYGHRNMFGLAFHPTSGRPYITENGPGDSDEVNRLVPGGNFGWPNEQGIVNQPPYIDPIRAYTPVIVPTNLAFYTAAVPSGSLNHLVFGSYQDRRLRELTLDSVDGTAVLNETVLATAPEGIIDVEMGVDGHLWVTTTQAIYRLVPTAAPITARPSVAVSMEPMMIAIAGGYLIGPRNSGPGIARFGDLPGSLRKDRAVGAARCRRIGSRTTTASSRPCGGSWVRGRSSRASGS